MIYDIEVLNQAETDLRGVYEYIAFELQAPENAGGQLDRPESSILELSKLPEQYRVYENEPWHSRGLHIMPVDHYCVLYIPDKEKDRSKKCHYDKAEGTHFTMVQESVDGAMKKIRKYF